MGETQSPPKRLRSRQCMFVLYPESQETAIKYAQENFPCAWALHDKDVHTEKAYQAYIEKNGEPPEWQPGDLKKPHIHFVCSFPNARYFSGIARDLGVPVNTIRKVNNLYKAYVYLWHMETVIAAMSDVFTLSGTVVTEITKQPILLFCLAAGLVPVGIHIFSSLKNAARG